MTEMMSTTIKAKDLRVGMWVVNLAMVSRIDGTLVWFDNGKVRNYSPEKDVTIKNI